MADLQQCFGATDLFNMESISSDFHAQDSSTNHSVDRVEVRGKSGGVACTADDINGRTEYSATYKYCGSTLGTHIDSILATFGAVRDSKLIDRVTINTTANDYPQIVINGHNHDENSHSAITNSPQTYDGSGIVVHTGGVGAVDWFDLGEVGSCIASSSIVFSLDHQDFVCNAGDHGMGVSMAATAEGSVEYVGSVDESGLTGWTYISSDASDSNRDVCKETITAYKQLDPTSSE